MDEDAPLDLSMASHTNTSPELSSIAPTAPSSLPLVPPPIPQLQLPPMMMIPGIDPALFNPQLLTQLLMEQMRQFPSEPQQAPPPPLPPLQTQELPWPMCLSFLEQSLKGFTGPLPNVPPEPTSKVVPEEEKQKERIESSSSNSSSNSSISPLEPADMVSTNSS